MAAIRVDRRGQCFPNPPKTLIDQVQKTPFDRCILYTGQYICVLYVYTVYIYRYGGIPPGCPQLSHLIRRRFVADPCWACLPRPPLELHDSAVVLRPRESTDVAVANLAGFVLDSVLLLSFGAAMAFAAAQERDQLLAQMGWHGCVGASLLPVEEHALADWEGTVQSRTQAKFEKLEQAEFT